MFQHHWKTYWNVKEVDEEDKEKEVNLEINGKQRLWKKRLQEPSVP